MAGEKTTKRKQKTTGGGEGGSALRSTSDPRKERRYEPKASTTAVISVVALSVGAVLLGAGTYGQWMRAEALGPHPYSPWLLLGGALLLIAIAVFGPRSATPLRVGDAGVGKESDGSELERLEWRDITSVHAGGGALVLESAGRTLTVPLKLHPQAAARILAEARARIPGKIGDVDEGGFASLDDGEGEVLPLEAPQIAGSRCKATDKVIAFEKDARLCGKCGEVYHKEAVPPKCLTCEAKLK